MFKDGTSSTCLLGDRVRLEERWKTVEIDESADRRGGQRCFQLVTYHTQKSDVYYADPSA